MAEQRLIGLKRKCVILGTVDRTTIKALRTRFNLASDSAAIRYALKYTTKSGEV